MTSQADIRSWLERAKSGKAFTGSTGKKITHVIVACDTFDWSDYPIFVTADQDIDKEMAKVSKLMEVYNMSLDLELQLNEGRAYHPYAIRETVIPMPIQLGDTVSWVEDGVTLTGEVWAIHPGTGASVVFSKQKALPSRVNVKDLKKVPKTQA